MTTPSAPTGDHGGLRGAVEASVQRILNTVDPLTAGHEVRMACVGIIRAALAAHPEPEPAQVGEVAAVLAEHRIDLSATIVDRMSHGSGNYWLVCNCGEKSRPAEDERHYLAHVAAVLVAAGVTR